MSSLGVDGIEISTIWTWFLLFIRLSAVFYFLPGIGTRQIPGTFRTAITFIMAVGFALASPQAAVPESFIFGTLMIGAEILLGSILGIVPSIVLVSVGVAGNVITGAMGLSQANMMDPSIGTQVTAVDRLYTLVATVVFLLIDGHHIILRAAAGTEGTLGIGKFNPDMDTFLLLLSRFQEAFLIAVSISAPVLVTVLIAQFVLGIITKFIPQVNIFIISFPLIIGVGLFIIGYTFPGLVDHFVQEMALTEEVVTRIITL